MVVTKTFTDEKIVVSFNNDPNLTTNNIKLRHYEEEFFTNAYHFAVRCVG